VLWLARTGAPWRDLPPELMNWRTAWRRLQRWMAAGVWDRIIGALRSMAPLVTAGRVHPWLAWHDVEIDAEVDSASFREP
jgi:transposase